MNPKRIGKWGTAIGLACVTMILAGALNTSAQGQTQATAKPANFVDLLITGATVVTMDADRRIIENGYVIVKGDSIIAIGDGLPQLPNGPIFSKQTIEAKGALVLPGFVNGHTHAAMSLLRGLHDDVTLDDWLRKYIFPAEAKNVTEDFVRWGTRLAAAEQIRSGVTTFADMYYFEDAVAEETKACSAKRLSIFQRQTIKPTPPCWNTPRGFLSAGKAIRSFTLLRPRIPFTLARRKLFRIPQHSRASTTRRF
jgi:5-methylthioadenosine/S-adenosylhomocysteine deaminase